ncbi:MAG: NAD(P)H-dependent oxidoreductase [Chloroflexaceae bacterium]|nr:NAD(P)H-dependent oxidoreductase [Chloroflexaceae bacterium]
MKTNILVLSGSLRNGSHTLKAAEAAWQGAAASGANTELLNLGDLGLPMFDDRDDTASYPPEVWEFLAAVGRADGLILASPVYHGTVSGAMKNALDFLHLGGRDVVQGKVAGLISVAGGGSGINTINTLDYVARALRMLVVPTTVAVPGSAFRDGSLHDGQIARRLAHLGQEVSRYARLLREEAEPAARIVA